MALNSGQLSTSIYFEQVTSMTLKCTNVHDIDERTDEKKEWQAEDVQTFFT